MQVIQEARCNEAAKEGQVRKLTKDERRQLNAARRDMRSALESCKVQVHLAMHDAGAHAHRAQKVQDAAGALAAAAGAFELLLHDIDN